MKDIGGYFGFENLISNEYYKELISLNSGRNALLYLIEIKHIKKLYIPHYLCDCIRDICSKNECDFECYNIDSHFLPVFSKELSEYEYIYIVNYYGQLSNILIENYHKKYKNIILDNAQAFFQKPLDGIDTLYSCRKFFGVSDGAYLSTDKVLEADIPIDNSSNRLKHILGRYEGEASEYYSDYQSIEATFYNEPLKKMSKITHNILGAIDYENVCNIRNINYLYLENELRTQNRIELTSPIGAFAYPFYIENGYELRKKLAKNKIYIPMLWPNVRNEMPLDSIEYKYVTNILPIPCDQRYGIEEMSWIVKNIKLL